MSYLQWEDDTFFISTLTFDVTLRETHTWESSVTEHPVEAGANVSDHVRPSLDKLSMDVEFTETPIESSFVQYRWGEPFNAAEFGYLALNHVNRRVLSPGQAEGTARTIQTSKTLQVQTIDIKKPPTRIGLTPTGLAVSGLNALLSMADPKTASIKAGLITTFSKQPVVILARREAGNKKPGEYIQTVLETLHNLKSQSTLVNVYTPRRTYYNMAIESISVNKEGPHSSVAVSISFKELRRVGLDTGTVNLPKPKAKKDAPKKEAAPAEKEKTAKDQALSILALLGELATGKGSKEPLAASLPLDGGTSR
jgi:hypothetical protein